MIPIPLVVIWVVANSVSESFVDSSHCGQGYDMVPTYWILEGPRYFVIGVNERLW